jgi:toxin YhaV
VSHLAPANSGWTVYAHPLFLDQFEDLRAEVQRAKLKDPVGYKKKRCTKRFFAISKIAFKDIPEDPTRDIYLLGATLGDAYKHWRRAKFLRQYRLFFLYQELDDKKVIVLLWGNDEHTLRDYESKSDAYATFQKMLKRGNPPDDWKSLKAAAETDHARARLQSLGRNAP